MQSRSKIRFEEKIKEKSIAIITNNIYRSICKI
jgi:hypothetical protein